VATAVLTDVHRRPLIHVLGAPVDVTDITGAVSTIFSWGKQGKSKAVFLRDIYGFMRSVQMPELMRMHERADLILADGTPLNWVAQLSRIRLGRVPGSDLIDAVCRESAGIGLRHYFFVGAPGVAERLAEVMKGIDPGLAVAGCYSPPMRSSLPDVTLSSEERAGLRTSPQAERTSFGLAFRRLSRRLGSQKPYNSCPTVCALVLTRHWNSIPAGSGEVRSGCSDTALSGFTGYCQIRRGSGGGAISFLHRNLWFWRPQKKCNGHSPRV
jgi:hypothetical protein